MNTKGLMVLMIAGALLAGYLLGSRITPEAPANATASAEPDILYWVAPMVPIYRR